MEDESSSCEPTEEKKTVSREEMKLQYYIQLFAKQDAQAAKRKRRKEKKEQQSDRDSNSLKKKYQGRKKRGRPGRPGRPPKKETLKIELVNDHAPNINSETHQNDQSMKEDKNQLSTEKAPVKDFEPEMKPDMPPKIDDESTENNLKTKDPTEAPTTA